jgi:NADH dehydrogenase
MGDKIPHVVIVGGGFGSLATAKALRNAPVHVTLLDRSNHHLFQPLLYQVATSVLTPGQIGSSIRNILRKQRNTTTILGEVSGLDVEKKCVFVNGVDRSGVPLSYDFLVLATGVTDSYFGHDEFATHAPGLKTLADAVVVRNRILHAFEQAEAEGDPRRHRDLLTFVLVGAGPTGVEMAGAIAVLIRNTLNSEFRRIDPLSARIVLFDAAPRVLGMFTERLSAAATKRLESLGVEVRLGHPVDRIDADGVIVNGERIFSHTVIWTAAWRRRPPANGLQSQPIGPAVYRTRRDLENNVYSTAGIKV